MDGSGGLTGYQWMFLIYGLVTIICGALILWWLPDRPMAPGSPPDDVKGLWKFFQGAPALKGEDSVIHYEDLTRVYHAPPWGLRELWKVMCDWRLWPLTVMYFGVVGVGIGVQSFGTLIIKSAIPKLTGVQLSLLFAPIWVCDLIAILIFTPLADRFHNYRYMFFIGPAILQMVGLLVTTYAGSANNPWPRYVGLLIVGFGLGPTVPNCMAWTSEIFQPRHGDIGVAAATALVSGLGNLGSVTTTYALYTGWASDNKPGPLQYRKSNLTMVGILAISVCSAMLMAVLRKVVDNNGVTKGDQAGVIVDGAARRDMKGNKGLDGLFGRKKKEVST